MVRCELGPSLISVPLLAMHLIAQRLQPGLGLFIECRDSLYGIDIGTQLGQDRSLVAGAGADLQYSVARRYLQGLGHQCDNVGL